MHRYNNLLHQCKANEKCGKLYGLFVAPAFLVRSMLLKCRLNEHARQLVLQLRRTGALAARARLSRAAGAARRLFALKTKHRVFHFEILTFMIRVLAFVAIL